MKRNILKTIEGSPNYINFVQIAAFLTGAVALVTDLIPPVALPYVLAGVAVFTLFANTFYGDTQGSSKG